MTDGIVSQTQRDQIHQLGKTTLRQLRQVIIRQVPAKNGKQTRSALNFCISILWYPRLAFANLGFFTVYHRRLMSHQAQSCPECNNSHVINLSAKSRWTTQLIPQSTCPTNKALLPPRRTRVLARGRYRKIRLTGLSSVYTHSPR